MEGIEMTKQERESMLYDEFGKFTYEPGELIHSYYLRYAKLINDMKMIPISMSNMQINTKFVNHLQPEWSRFVTSAKQARDLHDVNFDQLYAFLKHNEKDAKESPPLQRYASSVVPQQPPTIQSDSRFVVPTFLPTDDPIASLNKAMIFLSSSHSSRYPPTNNQLRTSSNPRTQATNQNGQVTVQDVQGRQSQGHIAKQCTTKKRVKDSEWFKEKMLLAQAQEAGVVLNDEQQDFLADSFEEIDDCEDLQLQAITNFKACHVDAYDSDCDDEATANAIFMANLSPVGSINDDTVELRYDSNILSEVPHYDTYHESEIQELEYIENIVSNNEAYDELTSNKNVISCTDYMVTIGNDKENYVPPTVQNNDRILSVQLQDKIHIINELKHRLAQCKSPKFDSRIQKLEDENVSLAFQINDQISKNNKLRAQLKAKFSESQLNQNGTSMNTKLFKPSTSGTKLYSVTLLPKSKVIPKVVEKNNLSKSVTSHLTTNKIIEIFLGPSSLKIESEPINVYFKNDRVVHQDYLKVTKEHVATLQELLEQARALKPLDENLVYASKFAEQIQELLVFVNASCPFTQSKNEK
ncbi:hypothetical protein Tco_0273467 [Tanacetum coccineum]